MALEEGSWLATETVVSPLADRINTSKQFTVAITVATFDLTQTGPARIVTLSEDPFHRNLTLGQAGGRLALRWRSPLTGQNGTSPELQFRGVFSSFEAQRVVISYDGITASVYTMGGAADLNVFLGPEVGFGAIFREASYWPVQAGRFSFWASALLLSALTFLPLGLLLGTAIKVMKRRTDQVGVMLGGIFLPALLLEGFVAVYRKGELRLEMVALGIAVTSLGLAVMQLWQRREPPKSFPIPA